MRDHQQATQQATTILVGDDDRDTQKYFETALDCYGYTVQLAGDGQEVIERLKQRSSSISAVLLDLRMPRGDGFEVLRQIRNHDMNLPVIMVSGESSPENVVEAMRSGATNFLGKPFNHEQLALTLARALNTECRTRIASEVISSGVEAFPSRSEDGHFAGGESMKEMHRLIAKIGASEISVLIQGETGSGKEVVARRLHQQTARAKKPLLKLNCAALPSELVESELFGYERGAFTGAFQRKAGMFELANGGTILLDEIGDMDYRLQAKLLQVLQDREIQRLGGREKTPVDVRVLAATHCDLDEAIAQGKFREDLLYRLNVVTIVVPPLRDRGADLIPLAEFLLVRHATPASVPRITAEMKEALLAHDWPGNVRELENVMRRYTILQDPLAIVRDLQHKSRKRTSQMKNADPVSPVKAIQTQSTSLVLEQVEKLKDQADTHVILKALESTHWNRKQAAKKLGIHYKALLYKMNKLSIEVRSEEGGEQELAAGATSS